MKKIINTFSRVEKKSINVYQCMEKKLKHDLHMEKKIKK